MISSHGLLRGPTLVGLRLGWALAGLLENEAVSWCATSSLPVCQSYFRVLLASTPSTHPALPLGRRAGRGLGWGQFPSLGGTETTR